jgi:hypothetical protein
MRIKERAESLWQLLFLVRQKFWNISREFGALFRKTTISRYEHVEYGFTYWGFLTFGAFESASFSPESMDFRFLEILSWS